MRNLKKILALVLALVMSLSLMATASAKQDFTDASSIDEKYATAVEVLNGLEVFKGYQNGSSYDFQPNGEITRAEVAAIIYRIATGDVKDEQVKIYADYNKFPDVPSTLWSAGYINYCANAEYVKGETNGKFNPEGKVTGYQALAMILRAIGYTANGGFTGPGWDLQTAAVGEARGITKNILKGTLNENATRQTVAEILFQAILVNMVNFDQRTGYYELGESLGYKIFKLEGIEGVVVANEYANLKSNAVLAEGKTKLETKDGIRDLNVGSELTDIGESRFLYVTGKTVLSSLVDTGKNIIWDSAENEGAAIKAADAIKKVGRDVKGTTQYFKNFEPVGYYLSDSRIEYEIDLALSEAEMTAFVKENGYTRYYGYQVNNAPQVAYDKNGNALKDSAGNPVYWWFYNKAIPVGEKITQADLDNIQDIFYRSNGKYMDADRTTVSDYIGKVFVRTQTANDISDDITYNEFFDTYINNTAWDITWGESDNGEWVKIVDYDSDGTVDYAFLTEYNLDRVTGTYTKNDKSYLQYNWLDELSKNYSVRYLVDDLKVNDVVIYTLIDGQALVERAASIEGKVTTVNFTKDTITLEDGTVKGQSGIDNRTEMLEVIEVMEPRTNYAMYLDKYGYVRAYELPGGIQYALVTELYATNANQGNLVKNWPLTVELTTIDGVTDEYSTPGSNNPFVALQPWTSIQNRAQINANFNNWLQPAIAHLGTNEMDRSAIALTVDLSTTFWSKNYQRINSIPAGGLNATSEFNYGNQAYYSTATGNWSSNQTNGTVSFTNVAAINKSDDSVTMSSASRYKLDKNGAIMMQELRDSTGAILRNPDGTAKMGPVFAVDYVQLSIADIEKGARHYNINTNYSGYATTNGYVDATHDTEYYIVYNGGVYPFTDYANFPGLTNDDNRIHAAYAVASNTRSDNDSQDYWVADVIVYEVEKWDNSKNTSIALAYWNGLKSVASASSVRYLDSLDSKAEGTQVVLRPAPTNWGQGIGAFGYGTWGYNQLGFYKVFDGSDVTNGEMTASKIEEIVYPNYNDNNIFAGYITRDAVIDVKGGFIDVCMNDGTVNNTAKLHHPLDIATFYEVVTNDGNGVNNTYTVSNALVLTSEVFKTDRLIWVMNENKVAFIVNLGSNDAGASVMSQNRWKATPQWLKDVWTSIMTEQVVYATADSSVITVKADTSNLPQSVISVLPGAPEYKQPVGSSFTLSDNDWNGTNSTALATALNAAGYQFKGFALKAGTPAGAVTLSATNNPTVTLNTKGNYVIEVQYEGVDHNVALVNNLSAGVSSVKATSAGGTETTLMVGAPGTVYNTAKTAQTVTLTVETTAELTATQSLEVEVKDAYGNSLTLTGPTHTAGTTTYAYTFTMPNGDVGVTKVDLVNAKFDITSTNNSVMTTASVTTPTATFKTDWLAAETITVAAAPGYTLDRIVSVTDGRGNAVAATVTNNYDGTFTVAITAGTNKNVVIETETTLATFDVTFNVTGFTGTYTARLNNGPDTNDNVNNGFKGVQVGDTITVTLTGAAPKSITYTAGSADYTQVESIDVANTYVLTFTAIAPTAGSTSVDITISNA